MKTLTLHLTGIGPENISLKRLAEYLKELNSLYGEEGAVSFDCVSEGSAMLQAKATEDAYPRVVENVRYVQSASVDTSSKNYKAYDRILDYMNKDGVKGSIEAADGSKIIDLSERRKKEKPITIQKKGSVQGRLYSIGGRDDTVPVKLEGRNNETLHCEADVSTAENLAPLLFKNVRLSGSGTWERQKGGGWKLRKLMITSYQQLDDSPLRDALKEIGSIKGITWYEAEAPYNWLRDERGYE